MFPVVNDGAEHKNILYTHVTHTSIYLYINIYIYIYTTFPASTDAVDYGQPPLNSLPKAAAKRYYVP